MARYNSPFYFIEGSVLKKLLLIPLYTTSLSALVSIAPVDIGSKPGFSGNVSGAISSKSGNTEKDEYSLATRLQYDQGSDYLIWGRFAYNYGKSEGVKNEDNLYAHLRVIHTFYYEDWNWEAFVQSEMDKFKDIKERSLGGADLRWRFVNTTEIGRGYAGIGALSERVRYTNTGLNPNEINTRLNTYIAYTQTFGLSASRFSYVGYYQPRFDDCGDFVSSQNLELIVPIYGQFNLSLSAKYLYDSRPPVGVEKTDTAYRTALVWEF